MIDTPANQGLCHDQTKTRISMLPLSQLSHQIIEDVGNRRIAKLFGVSIMTFHNLALDATNATILNYALKNIEKRDRKAPSAKRFNVLDFPHCFVAAYPEIANHAVHAKQLEMKLFSPRDIDAASKITRSKMKPPNYRDGHTGEYIHASTFERFQANGWARLSQRAPFHVVLTPLARKKIDDYNVANGLEPVSMTKPARRVEDRWSLTDCLKACRKGLPINSPRFEAAIIETHILAGKIVRDPLSGNYILTPKPPRAPRSTPLRRFDPLGVHLRTKLQNARTGALQRRHWGKLAARGLVDPTTGLLTPEGEKVLAT